MLTVNKKNLARILRYDAAPATSRLADRIAVSARNMAGQVNGRPINVIRDDDPTPTRARSAVIVTHPTDAGRAAARKAAEAAMRVAGGRL